MDIAAAEPSASPLAGREPPALAAALAVLALFAALATLIALTEPSLGWRFAPDPQGEGVLAYAPDRAIKVRDRAEAQERFVALRRADRPHEVLRLVSLVAVEAPSMLPRQEELDLFFVLQEQAWRLLAEARAQGQAIELQRAAGDWVRADVHRRGWNELGLLFWVPLLCGVVPFVVGAGVGVYRWQSPGARYLALASAMTMLSLAEVSVVTGRLWLLPPWFALWGQIWVRCASLGAVWAFAMLLLHYPTPLGGASRWTRATGALLGVLLVLNILEWPAQLALRYKLWLLVGGVAALGMGLWQGLSNRGDPVHRAAARWMAASLVVSFSIVLYSFAVSLVYDAQAVSNSYRWVSVPLLYIGLVFSVGRANLFELERWWVPLCLWWLGGTLVVLTDLALVALLHLNSGAAITVSLLAVGWLYFPLRQWVLSRLRLSSRARAETFIADLIGAVNAGLGGPRAASQAWRQLLVRVFDPEAIAAQGEPVAAPRIADSGRQLLVPDVGGQGAWRLTLAQRGRHLFVQEHVQMATQLWQLLELGLSQQRQTQVAVERERERIASDLHDDLGARLLTMVQAGAGDGTGAMARQALEEMRQSVRGMAGRRVDAAEAVADWRAELVGRLDGAGIAATWEAAEPPPGLTLPPRLHLQVTRILREAVSNVIRHSGARRCRVTLAIAESGVSLRVEDDGRGLPATRDGRGIGLGSVERRARQLGGHHAFGRSDDLGGAALQVEVPLAAPEADTDAPAHPLPSAHAPGPDR